MIPEEDSRAKESVSKEKSSTTVRDNLISIVVPLYNEESVLPIFYKALCAELDQLAKSEAHSFHFQILFVNDGSRDRSEQIIRELAQKDPRVEGIFLSRNFGHQAALTAGLDHAEGDAIICMDADLQHPPSLIIAFAKHWLQGYDIVYTIRRDSENKFTFKKFTSTLFYKLINLITDTPIQPDAADFRLIDKRVATVLRQDIRERHRFIRGIINWVGFSSIGLEFDVGVRASGYSKYSLSKMIRLAFNGIVSFSTAPLKFGIYLGGLLGIASLCYGIYAIVAAIAGVSVPGWASLLAVITFLGSMQLFLIGLLGFYIGYLFEEVKGRPIYIIRDRVSSSSASYDSCEDSDIQKQEKFNSSFF